MNSKAAPTVTITASLNVSKKQGKSIAPFIIKWLLVLFSCMGSVFSFLSCLAVPASRIAVGIFIPVFCTVFTLALNLKPKIRGTASIGASAVFLLFTWILRNEICGGLANTVNIYLARIRREFREKPLFLIIDPELAPRQVTIFICFFAAVICLAMAYCISKEWYAIGLCIPPLILPVMVMMFGLEPDYLAFSAVVASCAAAIAFEVSSAEKISSGRYKYAASYNGLAAAAAAVLCFALTAAAVKASGYERSDRINEMYNNITGYIERGEMKNAFSEVVTFVSKDSDRSGAINHGKLGEFDEIYFDGKTVLQVTIPKSENTVYLRGFVGSVYTGNSWKPLPSRKLDRLEDIASQFETGGLNTLLFDGFSLKYSGASMPKYSFSVKNVSAGRDYLYMPYNLVPESVSRYTLETGGGFAGGESSYLGQYYDPSGFYGYQGLFRMKWNISRTMAADEAAYRQFVYENYLDLPDDYTRLAEIFDENYYQYITYEDGLGEGATPEKSSLDEMTVFSRKLYYIRSWLRNNCEYSLSAGKLPRGRDFVDHFLENKKGSCSHFASTAVLMCRYAGIPARYVEGYIIKPAYDFSYSTKMGEAETIDVTDSRAHAWAEIYIDGFGWYPMEFTSGYGNIRTAIPTETLAHGAEPEKEVESTTEEEPSVTTVPEEPGEESGQTAPPQQPQNGSAASSAENSSAEETAVTTTVPEHTAESEETPDEPSMPDSVEKPSVGFGIFGFKGSKKADIVYDLTVPVLTAAAVLIVIMTFILRRRICLSLYKKKCRSGKKAAAFASYKKFCRIADIMKLPKQGELGSSEYAKMLSGRSALLSDGTAELIIQTALKASFGGGRLTSDEAGETVFAAENLTKRYYLSLSKLGKFKLKYIYCLI